MKRSITVMFAVLLVGMFMTSCSMETDGRDYISDGDESSTNTDGDDTDAVEISDTEGSSTYAMQEKLYVRLDILGDGSLMQDMVITNTFLANIDPDGTLHRSPCSVDMSEVLSNKSYMEKSTVEHLSVSDTENFVSTDGTVDVQNHVWLWGWHTEDPLNDTMPDDKNDSRIFDQDEDGNPGVTTVVKNSRGAELGKRFFIRRAIKNYSGSAEDDREWITGTITFALEDFVVDGTSTIAKTAPETTPDESKTSTFVLRRIPANSTCEYIEQQGAGLFVKEGADNK